MLLDAIRSGRLQGRTVDWGAFAAAVTLDEIHQFIEECFHEIPDTLAELIATLDPAKKYALVMSGL